MAGPPVTFLCPSLSSHVVPPSPSPRTRPLLPLRTLTPKNHGLLQEGEVRVTFKATLTVTLGSLAFQEIAGSFCPSPYNEASFGVWVWMGQGPPPPPLCIHFRAPSLQKPQGQGGRLGHLSAQSPQLRSLTPQPHGGACRAQAKLGRGQEGICTGAS